MMRDVLTVVWKEWREFRDQLFKIKRGGLSALIMVFFLGVVTPWQLGPQWLSSGLMLLYWPILASSMVSTLIADAIAGERERHTLETLLASRLPDAAILYGKVIAAVLYGFTFAATNIVVGWVVVNVRYFDGNLMGIPPRQLLALLALLGTASFFVAGLGVFISLRAATVRQAQQTFGVIMLLLFLAPVFALQLIPADVRERMSQSATTFGIERIVFWASTTLGVFALAVNLAAKARFRRGKLSLD
jgi:ABC-2 type transport system permease protein